MKFTAFVLASAATTASAQWGYQQPYQQYQYQYPQQQVNYMPYPMQYPVQQAYPYPQQNPIQYPLQSPYPVVMPQQVDPLAWERDCTWVNSINFRAALSMATCGFETCTSRNPVGNGGSHKRTHRTKFVYSYLASSTDLDNQPMNPDGGKAISQLPTMVAGFTAAKLDEGFHVWGSVMNRAGRICAVAYTGSDLSQQFPFGRIQAMKRANTANSLSVPHRAMPSHVSGEHHLVLPPDAEQQDVYESPTGTATAIVETTIAANGAQTTNAQALQNGVMRKDGGHVATLVDGERVNGGASFREYAPNAVLHNGKFNQAWNFQEGPASAGAKLQLGAAKHSVGPDTCLGASAGGDVTDPVVGATRFAYHWSCYISVNGAWNGAHERLYPDPAWYGFTHDRYNPGNLDVHYQGAASNYGEACGTNRQDPMCMQKPGGYDYSAGGLALFDSQGVLRGAIGVAGDNDCASHAIAWKTREQLGLDFTPVNTDRQNNNQATAAADYEREAVWMHTGSKAEDNVVFNLEEAANFPACYHDVVRKFRTTNPTEPNIYNAKP